MLAGIMIALAVIASNSDDRRLSHSDRRQRETELLERVVEIPTVAGRNEMSRLADVLSQRFQLMGLSEVTRRRHGDTESMIVRWRSSRPSGRKPILLLAHMDVVEARSSDWQNDPFEFREAEGYYWGRGIADNKAGLVAIVASLARLRESRFEPSRDIIVLFTGDEETDQNGARLAGSEWRSLIDSEFALNSDIGGGTVFRDGRAEAFTIQIAEKTYANYRFVATNRGGHSARPRPDNAIYQLAGALKALEEYRFTPTLNEANRAHFQGVAEQDRGTYGALVRAWLDDPGNPEKADLVEAIAPGMTRTRCVATQLDAGHAPNALPQRATANVNCRIFPGTSPDEILVELQAIAGQGVTVEAVGEVAWSQPSAMRPDVLAAYERAVRQRFPGTTILPAMSAGATDAVFIRAAGIPTYGVAGMWSYVGEPLGTHGLDERVPIASFHDQIDIWEEMLRLLTQ